MDRSYLDFTYRSMGPIVMGFDMIEVRGAAERCIVPVQLLKPSDYSV